MVATHPAGTTKSRVGVTRAGVVYELFLTKLSQDAFTASDVVALYLHRGAFENTLADEDLEQDPDRWCSHAACGQETWQIISQWVWNLRLELGHQLAPEPVRTTEFAPALAPAHTRGDQLAFPFTGVWVGRSGLALESGPLLGARLCSPARWHAALSCRAVAGCARAAQRSRREPAGRVCGQHPQLSPLSPARTVSMAWEGYHKAPSGERAAAPAPHRFCAPPLEGLEP